MKKSAVTTKSTAVVSRKVSSSSPISPKKPLVVNGVNPIPPLPLPNPSLRITDSVLVTTAAGKKDGIVRYIGNIVVSPGIWIGVELPQADGRNDGSIQGIRYFECLPNRGIFVKESACIRITSATTTTSTTTIATTTVTATANHDTTAKSADDMVKAIDNILTGSLSNSLPPPQQPTVPVAITGTTVASIVSTGNSNDSDTGSILVVDRTVDEHMIQQIMASSMFKDRLDELKIEMKADAEAHLIVAKSYYDRVDSLLSNYNTVTSEIQSQLSVISSCVDKLSHVEIDDAINSNSNSNSDSKSESNSSKDKEIKRLKFALAAINDMVSRSKGVSPMQQSN